jgi:predicted dehydrogenase/threonine dehydrogenase-like Zn-dependent dehydrogenase
VKQILQSLKSGVTEVADVPAPRASRGQVLIRSTRTLISAGTERMLVGFGKANLLDKARQQPDKVKMAVDKMRTDGVGPTLNAIRSKLDQPMPLGYCNVGVVVDVGAGVTGFAIGDRVISNGAHAEIVSVPMNLCAKIPDGVSDDHAAFTVLSSIALQGIRLLNPTLGEAIVVTGLGLIGQLAVQLLRAHGCRVLGLDYDPAKLALARQFGAETVDLSAGQDPLPAAAAFSRFRGVDGVLITASTQSSEPMHQAALMCRQRGRIVLVGVVGLELLRDDFYKKELTFQVSSSYGPGRYDPSYEERGNDYPVGFVRWTEQRNFEAVLDMMAEERLDVAPLVSHRFPLAEAPAAYDIVTGGGSSLGILLEYPEGGASPAATQTVPMQPADAPRQPSGAAVSFIGAGNYATAVLIPAFRDAGATLHTVASKSGVSGVHAARKFGFAQTTTDTDALIADPSSQVVVITTRHNSHARLVIDALQAGKHVFVEKPLCLTLPELDDIQAVYADRMRSDQRPHLMVGFNRRFAPHVVELARQLRGAPGPKAFVMTVNAGPLPAEHWTQDREIGGGRVIGEACHFIDLLRHLAGVPISATSIGAMNSPTKDSVSIQLQFEDGSLGTILYLANGNREFPKERLEVFAGGRVAQLDNFRRASAFGWPGYSPTRLWSQDKGQAACAAAFVAAVKDGRPTPIAFDEIVEVSRITIELADETWR